MLLRFLLPLLLLLLGSCGTSHVEGYAPGECSDRADNDGNGLYDCDDPSCTGAPDCLGDDDDSSGDDDDAAGDDDGSGDDDTATGDDDDDTGPAGHEDCSNGIDDDGDGVLDCKDSDCECDPDCGGSGGNSEVGTDNLGCGDGLDGDCDGLFDCEDHDCKGSPLCPDEPGGGEEYPPCCDTMSCADNDGDCINNPAYACQQPGLPWSGDAAGDGPDDCGDFNSTDCISCYDGLDGDNDGGADCNDPEALAVQASGELASGIPNCYYVRLCDPDPSMACP